MLYDAHAVVPSVSVGGPLLPPLARNIVRIVVEAQRNMPAMCEVEFRVEDSMVIDNPLMRPGQSLKVDAGPASEDLTQRSVAPLFDGEVVAVEASFTPEGGRRFVLRGYDKSHRMHRSRKTRTFLMQPDSVIVSQIASDYGLAPRVDPTPGTNEYLCQRNQTDWEFLAERAREIGFEMKVAMGQLVFQKAGSDPMAGIPQRLNLGSNLLTFRLRATSAEQPQMTKVQSWNTLLKTSVLGVATPDAAMGESTPQDATLLPMTIAAQFGSTEEIATDIPMDLPPAAMTNAAARRSHAASAAIEAEGTCMGNPAMVPGGKVSIGEVGLSFSGDYVLSTVRHVFDEGGFVSHFTVSGTHDRSLLGLAQPGLAMRANGHGGGASLMSPVIAKVSNTNDELMMGRVKVELPWLGDSAESNWAHVVSPGAGDGKGLQVIPEVGDTVLVVFEQGDVRHPFVLGGIYNTQDMMPSGPVPPPVVNGETNIRMFKTRAGHVLTFDDSPGQEAITLETNRGSKLVIQEGPTNKIELIDATGQNSVTIDGASSSIALKAMGDLQIESVGQLKLKGTAGVEIEGNGPVNVKSTAMLSLDGGPTAELKGGVVRIN
jgi:phage protein D/phage baseplate assembly protein gpV